MLKLLGGKVAAVGIRLFLNGRYGRYGVMTQLKIDNVHKRIDLELLLDGEKEPIQVHLGDYQLVTDAGGTSFRAGEIAVSRAWMNRLAEELLRNKPLAIPESLAKWLPLIL